MVITAAYFLPFVLMDSSDRITFYEEEGFYRTLAKLLSGPDSPQKYC
jgi:hypothetical protein